MMNNGGPIIIPASGVSKKTMEDYVDNHAGGVELGETSETAHRGDQGKTAYDHSQATHAPASAEANNISDVDAADLTGGGATTLHSHAALPSGMDWSIVAINTSAVTLNGYLVDCSAGVITVTLPATPAEGDVVGVYDYTETSETNNITIARNGVLIGGDAEDLIIDINGAGFTLVYTDAAVGWKIVSEINSNTVVVSDAAYGANWEDVVDVAPSKNALYDKIETLGNLAAQVLTPTITSPTTGATGTALEITVTGSTYRSLYGYDQSDAQIQIAESSDFVSTTVDTVTGTAVASFDVTGLSVITLYYCRIRYQDSADRWSEWSPTVSFTTANIYIDTPTNASPASLETSVAETPTLTSDAFECINGSDTHLNSDWEVYSDASLTTLVWSSYADTTNKSTATIPAGELSDGTTDYWWRCRHEGTTYGDSAWSTATKFTTKNSFTLIYGIAMVSSGGGSGTWQRVDENGGNITLTTTDFNNHAVWGGIETVTIDSQTMVKVPKFYIKVGTLTGGDQVGKKAWLVSDSPATGFVLHPAFMDGGVEIDQFYYGAYEASDDGGTAAKSITGVAPLVSIDFTAMQARCAARNTGGVDGFSMVNIHQLSAVQLLCMIENGGPDVQSTIGVGNTASSAAVNTGTSNAVWRGIYELWGNVYCGIDGVQWDTNNQIKIFDRLGNGTYVSTGITASATDGWITGMHDDSGTGFDLSSAFLGESFDATESNGTFGDYEYSPDFTEDNVCYHGGRWSNGSSAGLFLLNLCDDASYSHTRNGFRLAKV